MFTDTNLLEQIVDTNCITNYQFVLHQREKVSMIF